MGDIPVNDMSQVIHSDRFDIDPFSRDFKYGNDCKDEMKHNEETVMIENGFPWCTLQNYARHLTVLVVHYKQDVIKVSQEQASLAPSQTGFLFRPLQDLFVYGARKTMQCTDHPFTMRTTLCDVSV